jgi:hypothetical protein
MERMKFRPLTENQQWLVMRAFTHGEAELHGRGSNRSAKGLEDRGLVTRHFRFLPSIDYHYPYVRLTDAGREYARSATPESEES